MHGSINDLLRDDNYTQTATHNVITEVRRAGKRQPERQTIKIATPDAEFPFVGVATPNR
jgi:hypothetical protein